MFNRLKREIIQEVIDELQNICIEYDTKAGEKVRLNEDATFEISIGFGLRKAISKAYEIKDSYR